MNKHEGSDFQDYVRQSIEDNTIAACSKCGSININDGVIIDTNPSIWKYKCLDCGEWTAKVQE